MRHWMLVGLGLVVAACVTPAPVRAETPPVELDGSWYVLVHYRDMTGTHAGVDLWRDHIWKFKVSGERLDWIEYPTVVFKDEGRRFRTLESGRKVQSDGSWLPTPRQHREIRTGLRVTDRGQRTKSLRGGCPNRG